MKWVWGDEDVCNRNLTNSSGARRTTHNPVVIWGPRLFANWSKSWQFNISRENDVWHQLSIWIFSQSRGWVSFFDPKCSWPRFNNWPWTSLQIATPLSLKSSKIASSCTLHVLSIDAWSIKARPASLIAGTFRNILLSATCSFRFWLHAAKELLENFSRTTRHSLYYLLSRLYCWATPLI